MTQRTSLKEVSAVFDRLCAVTGHRRATAWNDVGGWQLDSNPTYGGWNIEEIMSEGGSISHPMGPMRLPAGAFVQAMHFAINAVIAAKRPSDLLRA